MVEDLNIAIRGGIKNGYSTRDDTQYVGFTYQHIEDKINELVAIVNRQQVCIDKLRKEVTACCMKYDN